MTFASNPKLILVKILGKLIESTMIPASLVKTNCSPSLSNLKFVYNNALWAVEKEHHLKLDLQ